MATADVQGKEETKLANGGGAFPFWVSVVIVGGLVRGPGRHRLWRDPALLLAAFASSRFRSSLPAKIRRGPMKLSISACLGLALAAAAAAQIVRHPATKEDARPNDPKVPDSYVLSGKFRPRAGAAGQEQDRPAHRNGKAGQGAEHQECGDPVRHRFGARLPLSQCHRPRLSGARHVRQRPQHARRFHRHERLCRERRDPRPYHPGAGRQQGHHRFRPSGKRHRSADLRHGHLGRD